MGLLPRVSGLIASDGVYGCGGILVFSGDFVFCEFGGCRFVIGFWLLWLCICCGSWMDLVVALEWCLLLRVGGLCLGDGLSLVLFAGLLLF